MCTWILQHRRHMCRGACVHSSASGHYDKVQNGNTFNSTRSIVRRSYSRSLPLLLPVVYIQQQRTSSLWVRLKRGSAPHYYCCCMYCNINEVVYPRELKRWLRIHLSGNRRRAHTTGGRLKTSGSHAMQELVRAAVPSYWETQTAQRRPTARPAHLSG